jgi:hypothetical protein
MANATTDSMKAKRTKAKDDVPQEKAPWETADTADQELEVFVAPDTSQYRRKLGEAELIAWVAAQVKGGDQDEQAMWKSIFAQIAEADTVDEILNGKAETVKGKEILDTVLECNSIKFIPSTEAKGFPYFAILDVRYGPNRTQETISVGGVMVVAQLAYLHYRSVELTIDSPYRVAAETPGALAKESFPHYFKIRKKTTPNGEMNYLVGAMA